MWESSSGFDVGQFVIIGLCGLIVLIVLALIAAQLTIFAGWFVHHPQWRGDCDGLSRQ
ncbi:hypothetical protein FORC4_p004 (plasmid) [Vibrio parahaemolyticus]|nr:hypothetical protein FORC4_p004 [Vibrio parahaemolyticus]